ncbi:hypothetical protein LZ554_001912 [Drepanopeziza brunnea f. sp. 'monogermtubi']|nr:hypothetical protein LZ554_001912 [Drepanopeziza brunnea f. sp. 'monogermtubi']
MPDFYIPSSGVGYEPAWGPPTSTLNFCEEDYQFTPYIAELFNTLTNLTYIGLGIRGIINTRKHGERSIGPMLPYIALINLGIASSLFHSSLKYGTQMCDEFSMLIATFLVFYRLLNFSQTRFSPRSLLLGLSGLMGAVIISQVLTGESTLQQIVFTTMVYWLWHTCFKLISKLEGDDAMRKKMKWTAISGIGFFVTGHICWITDFKACGRLLQMRNEVGMPWAAVLELHGLWHIFTGIGVYIFMVLVECLQAATAEKSNPGARLSSSGSWPFMVYLEGQDSKHETKNK